MLTSSLPEVIGSARRPWRTHGEASLLIEASPQRLYDLVADVASASARAGEVQDCVWLAGPPPGTAGSRFRGRNRAGVFRWSRVCEVVTAVRGKEFAFYGIVMPHHRDPRPALRHTLEQLANVRKWREL
jgi:hypothetical protein